ncbi:trypsin-like peptidase domain-containing protein [Brevibacillus nitrificans]|uniref:trypsin-like peptidase domain-containing protein n=1 Tax=Brevibacillus nitrificans TaxID=651560 RepID=UPI00262664E9|nr:trypsin-like peptidase domain-containing protein [Brevibacillus nitrificans]MED1796003.1 trypsin-like peptidase domain-containing protein [Brevibacillus nitrificans]
MKSKKWSHYTRVKYPVSSSSLHPFNFFVPIVERVQEGVVSIVTEDAPHSKNMDSLIRSLINEEETPSTTERSFGSGFLFHPKGYILTSEHVIGKSKNIYVKLFNGRVFEAQRILSDRVRDYAVIKIDADCKLFPLPLGNSAHTKVGEWVISVGSPLVAIGPKSAARSALPSLAREQLHLFGQPLRFFLNQVTGILYGSANGLRV